MTCRRGVSRGRQTQVPFSESRAGAHRASMAAGPYTGSAEVGLATVRRPSDRCVTPRHEPLARVAYRGSPPEPPVGCDTLGVTTPAETGEAIGERWGRLDRATRVPGRPRPAQARDPRRRPVARDGRTVASGSRGHPRSGTCRQLIAPEEATPHRMLRLLHTADVHLGARHADLGEAAIAQRERQFAAFVRTIDVALAESVDVVLIAGDLFDSNVQPRRSVERVAAELRRLVERRIRTVITPGTHDVYDRASVYRAYDLPSMAAPRDAGMVVVLTPEQPARSSRHATSRSWAGRSRRSGRRSGRCATPAWPMDCRAAGRSGCSMPPSPSPAGPTAMTS